MELANQKSPPRVFLLRLWLERLGDDRYEWRGEVQDASGEVRYFRGWPMLGEALNTMLPSASGEHGSVGP